MVIADLLWHTHYQVSNSYLHFLRGRGTQMIFEFFKDMPRIETLKSIDIGSLIGSLFFVWIVLQLFPVSTGQIRLANVF